MIHRDLKPANIKVDGHGTVKVLDFGLAKAIDSGNGSQPGSALLNSPTITSPAMTQGLILGTAAYMSPEQAKGRAVDKRTDVWAFGCVLYEMLTGKRAFGGEDVTETIAEVVRAEPDWTKLPDDASPQLRLLLKRCLENDRGARVADLKSTLSTCPMSSSSSWPRTSGLEILDNPITSRVDGYAPMSQLRTLDTGHRQPALNCLRETCRVGAVARPGRTHARGSA